MRREIGGEWGGHGSRKDIRALYGLAIRDLRNSDEIGGEHANRLQCHALAGMPWN